MKDVRRPEQINFKTYPILPTVYADSLSYQELLYKVLHTINEVVDLSNITKDEVNELYEFIHNSGLSEIVDKILNEWYATGRLGEIINEFLFTEINNQMKDDEVYSRESTGYGVLVGLDVLAQENPDMSVMVKAGIAHTYAGKRYIQGSDQRISIPPANAQYGRWDIIYITPDGILTHLAGEPSATPIKPTVQEGSIILAYVYVNNLVVYILQPNIEAVANRKVTLPELIEMFKKLETDVYNLGLNVDEHRERLDGHGDKLVELEQKDTEIEQNLTTLENNFNDSVQSIEEDIASIDLKVTEQEQRIDDLELQVGEDLQETVAKVNQFGSYNREATGYGVISGLKVEPQATPNMSVMVQNGSAHSWDGYRYNQPVYETVIIEPTDGVYPRIDVIYITPDGKLSYGKGVASSIPVAPTPVNGVVLAEILVSQTTTKITTSEIVDKRMFKTTLPELNKSVVLLSKYAKGDGTNETEKIQQAINESVGKTLVWNKQQGSHYSTKPLNIPSNTNIIIEPGTLIKAESGYGLNDRVFNIFGVSNVNIQGNYATIQMLKSEYTTGEHRHCIYIIGDTNNINIEKLVLKDSGGDGVLVGGVAGITKNIKIVDCTMDNNRRQGISVCGNAENILIDNCKIINTNGTAPQFGIDIEPNDSTMDNVNVTVQNCFFDNNVGGSIAVYDNSYNVKILNNYMKNGQMTIKRFTETSATPTVKVIGNSMPQSLIYIDGVSGVLVENNYALRILATSYVGMCEALKIKGNKFINSTSAGIDVSSFPNSEIVNNYIENTDGLGISLVGSAGTIISDNYLKSCGTDSNSVSIQTSNYVVFTNNRLRRGTKTLNIGVILSANTSNTLVENNDFYDCGTRDIVSYNTSTTFGVNRWLSGATSVYTVPDFLPAATSGYVGRCVALKKPDEETKLYTCVESSTGTFIWKRLFGKIEAQSDSVATDVEELKSDFNALLAKLRSANLM